MVAVVALDVGRSLESSRAALEAAFTKGLGAGGVGVIDPQTSRARLAGKEHLAGCKEEACLKDASAQLGAAYLAYGEIVSTRKLYAVTLSLLDAEDGRTLATAAKECRASDPCPPVANTVNELARALGKSGRAEIDLVTRQRARAATAVVEPAPEPVAVAEKPPVVEAPAAPVVAPPASASVWKSNTTAVALVGGGALLLGGGMTLVALDGCTDRAETQSSGTVCTKQRSSAAAGYITGAVGVAAIAAGVVWWWHRRGDAQNIALTFGPGHVGLWGNF